VHVIRDRIKTSKMAQLGQHSTTLEQKIDLILSKVSKIESIERHLVLLQQDMSVIKGEMKQLDTRMSDIENSVAYMETDFTELNETVKKETQRTNSIERCVKSMKVDQDRNVNNVEQKAQIDFLKTQNELLSRHINEIDGYNRRSNLIIEGVQESKSEVPWNKVQDVIYNYMGIDTRHMKIERCHRLQGSRSSPKPIIVRFNWFADRQQIWEKRRYLKGSQYYLREDFPSAVQKTRRSLNHTLALARTADKKALLKNDMLIFKGEAYQADNIPSEVLLLGDAGPGAKVESGQVCFGGRASPFSNFYRAPFKVDGKLFQSNEHFYQYNKAMFANDEVTAAAIMAESDPAKAKRWGDKVTVSPEWYGNTALNVMTSGIVQKFSQNDSLKELFTKCSALKFVECNQYDKYWGNGLRFTDREIGNPSKWKGRNMLGACLNEAAKHFRRSYSQAVKH